MKNTQNYQKAKEPKRFQIRAYESGDVIDAFDTYEEAEMEVEEYIKEDKRNEEYEIGFYEIYDTVAEEIIETF